MTLAEYSRLKANVEQCQAEAARAEGALAQLNGQLAEFGVKDLAEAEKLLAKLTKEVEWKEREADAALREFERKHKARLNGEK